jgi:hypothetical protein
MKGFDDFGQIILGIPVLHHLGLLPAEQMAKFAGRKPIEFKGVPAVFGNKVDYINKINVNTIAVLDQIDLTLLDHEPGDDIDEPNSDDDLSSESPDAETIQSVVKKISLLQKIDKDLVNGLAEQYIAYEKLYKEEDSSFHMPKPDQFLSVLVDYQDIFRTVFGNDEPAKVTPMPFEWDETKQRPGHCNHIIRLSKEADDWLEGHLDILIKSDIEEKVLPDPKNVVSFSAPIFVVPKKQNQFRMVEDFRKLNQSCKLFNFPLPNIENVLEYLCGARYFGSLDLIKGYNQFPCSKEAENAFVISTSRGLFKFKRVPMGFSNSGPWFQHVMSDEVLKDLIY